MNINIEVNCFLADTQDRNIVAISAEILLIMKAAKRPNFDLPNDDKILAKMCRLPPYIFAEKKPDIFQNWELKNNVYVYTGKAFSIINAMTSRWERDDFAMTSRQLRDGNAMTAQKQAENISVKSADILENKINNIYNNIYNNNIYNKLSIILSGFLNKVSCETPDGVIAHGASLSGNISVTEESAPVPVSEKSSEISPEIPHEKPARKKAEKGTRLSAWMEREKINDIPQDWGEWAYENGMTESEINWEWDKFLDFWKSKSGLGGTKLDWLATWKNWCRRNIETKKRKDELNVIYTQKKF